MRTMEVEKSCDGSSSSRNLRVSMETMRMVVGGFKCWRRRAKSVDWCINFLCASVCVCLLSGLDGERAGRSAFQSALSLSLSLSTQAVLGPSFRKKSGIEQDFLCDSAPEVSM